MVQATIPNLVARRNYLELEKQADEHLESDDWKGIPIVIVTGMKPEFEHFISTRRQVPPPEGYIAKPIEEKDLLAEVRRHLAA